MLTLLRREARKAQLLHPSRSVESMARCVNGCNRLFIYSTFWQYTACDCTALQVCCPHAIEQGACLRNCDTSAVASLLATQYTKGSSSDCIAG